MRRFCGPTKPKRKRTAMYPRRCLAVLSDPWRLVVARYMHRIGSKTRGARGSGAARASRDRPGGSEAFTRRFTHTNDLTKISGAKEPQRNRTDSQLTQQICARDQANPRPTPGLRDTMM